jgi:hypothetical protein
MNRNEQLAMWVRGQSVHDTERDECCPDFSCCNPELLAAKEEREHFLASVKSKLTSIEKETK